MPNQVELHELGGTQFHSEENKISNDFQYIFVNRDPDFAHDQKARRSLSGVVLSKRSSIIPKNTMRAELFQLQNGAGHDVFITSVVSVNDFKVYLPLTFYTDNKGEIYIYNN